MTDPRTSPVPLGAPSEEEDDHDLLTYAIASDRLRAEIAAQQRLHAGLAAAHGENSAEAGVARNRLEQLTRALERQAAARAGRANDRDFFGEADPGTTAAGEIAPQDEPR